MDAVRRSAFSSRLHKPVSGSPKQSVSSCSSLACLALLSPDSESCVNKATYSGYLQWVAGMAVTRRGTSGLQARTRSMFKRQLMAGQLIKRITGHGCL